MRRMFAKTSEIGMNFPPERWKHEEDEREEIEGVVFPLVRCTNVPRWLFRMSLIAIY